MQPINGLLVRFEYQPAALALRLQFQLLAFFEIPSLAGLGHVLVNPTDPLECRFVHAARILVSRQNARFPIQPGVEILGNAVRLGVSDLGRVFHGHAEPRREAGDLVELDAVVLDRLGRVGLQHRGHAAEADALAQALQDHVGVLGQPDGHRRDVAGGHVVEMPDFVGDRLARDRVRRLEVGIPAVGVDEIPGIQARGIPVLVELLLAQRGTLIPALHLVGLGNLLQETQHRLITRGGCAGRITPLGFPFLGHLVVNRAHSWFLRALIQRHDDRVPGLG